VDLGTAFPMTLGGAMGLNRADLYRKELQGASCRCDQAEYINAAEEGERNEYVDVLLPNTF
jgi:hypothetical protein